MARGLKKVLDLATADSLNRRLFTLWALGIGINLVAWTVGHFLLPEGLLRGALPAPSFIPDTGEWGTVLGRILLYNIGFAASLIVLANLFRIGRFPLGYAPVLFHWTMYGLFLGTNSFGVVRDRLTTPDPIALVRSPGFVELTAYTFIAAATIGLHLYEQDSIWQLRATRVHQWKDVALRRCEVATLAVAMLLIVGSGAVEATRITAHESEESRRADLSPGSGPGSRGAARLAGGG